MLITTSNQQHKTTLLAMDSKNTASCLIILMMFCGGNADFAQDKKECQDQLVSLSPCLNFVSGEAKSPSPSCCSELKKDVQKSRLCLCILVRDRDEPDLGFKLNATRALSLIPLCQVQSNATICPALLHLPPDSPEAQVFEQFGNGTSAGEAEAKASSSTKLSVEGIRQAATTAFLVWTSSWKLLEAAGMF